MEYLELITESLRIMLVNKMRTGLAALGIVIGIGSVIALVSLGQATQQSVQNSIQALGANLLTINPTMRKPTILTNDDAAAIATAKEITTIQNVSPEISRRSQITTGSNNTNTQIIGATPIYATVHKVSIANGNFLSQNDMNSLNKVAVLGPQVVTDLFGDGANPLGQTIRINGQSLTVIGVTVSKGGTGFANQDDIVFVPLTIAQKQLFGLNYLTSIALEAKNPDVMTAAQDEVGYFLLAKHKISDPTNADFSIFSQADILNAASSTTGTFTTLLSGIAAISLIVGGIGIMNIMLVTVTERTREIGLRKALGAKRKVIITQFLIEAIILTFSGGVTGIILGVIASFIIASVTNSPFIIAWESILIAFGVSALIGIIFGWYPARKASNLQPIEALRYE